MTNQGLLNIHNHQPELGFNTHTRDHYLTFHLQDGIYAIDILQVLEIRGNAPVTPLPGTPGFVKGIMNLRGAIVPVIDLSIRLGLEPAIGFSRFAVMIVTRTQGKLLALIADAANEVITVPANGLSKPPSVAENEDNRFIRGVVLHYHESRPEEPEMVVVLDLDQLYDPAFESMHIALDLENTRVEMRHLALPPDTGATPAIHERVQILR